MPPSPSPPPAPSTTEPLVSVLSPRPAAVRLLREELQLLQEPGSYVGEVIKVRAGRSGAAVRRPERARFGCRLLASVAACCHVLFRSVSAALPSTQLLSLHRCHPTAADGQEQGAGQGEPGGQVRGGPR